MAESNVDPIQVPVVDEQHSGDIDIARLKEYLHSLNTISKGITKIQRQQLRDRRRLSLHSDTNNATYNEVFAGSIVETFIFICVSVFQVLFSLSHDLPYILLITRPCRYFLSGVGLSPKALLRPRAGREAEKKIFPFLQSWGGADW